MNDDEDSANRVPGKFASGVPVLGDPADHSGQASVVPQQFEQRTPVTQTTPIDAETTPRPATPSNESGAVLDNANHQHEAEKIAGGALVGGVGGAALADQFGNTGRVSEALSSFLDRTDFAF